MNFREKGGSLQSEKFVAKKRNIVFRNEGGGSEAVWKFSENSSKIVHAIVPNLRLRQEIQSLNLVLVK